MLNGVSAARLQRLKPASVTTWFSRFSPATHVREAFKPDGTWMIVEPNARDRPPESLR